LPRGTSVYLGRHRQLGTSIIEILQTALREMEVKTKLDLRFETAPVKALS
jgi:hypothetical protein